MPSLGLLRLPHFVGNLGLLHMARAFDLRFVETRQIGAVINRQFRRQRGGVAGRCDQQVGDAGTWTAIEADSKLIVSYLIGGCDAGATQGFMHGVADGLAHQVQLTPDVHGAYLSIVLGTFGIDVDYA